MIQAGYLYKKVAVAPAWLGDAHVVDIHSLSGCMSKPFCDYVAQWRHNGHWLFDDPAVMHDIAQTEGISLDGMTLFYYEVYEQEFDEITGLWSALQPSDLPADVTLPRNTSLSGFDIATFSQRNLPECSPLSCNRLCTSLAVNAHCLLESLDAAKEALVSGLFKGSEPGPMRIFSVYRVTPETTDPGSSVL